MRNVSHRKITSYLKIAAFVFAFVILLETLSLTVFSKQKTALYNNKYSKAYSFTLEPENSIQIAGIGNSDLYSGFVPSTLWEEFGYTSTLISSPHQTTLESYKMFEELLKRQKPELLMIEVDMLYNSMVEGANKIQSEKGYDDYYFDYFNTDDFQDVIENHFSIFTFHDRWKNFGKQEKLDLTPHSHGYKYSSRTKKIKPKKYMIKSDGEEKIAKASARYFGDIIKLCRNKDIKVFLVEFPTMTSWNYERHNAVSKLAKEYELDFIDLNLCLDEMNLNIKDSFRDKGNHLNYNGAEKITRYVGNYIRKNYTVKDRRNDPEYSFWYDTVTAFKNEMKAKDV